MNRRKFLILLESILATSIIAAEPNSKKSSTKKRIIVIGAGLSGLAAAKQLHNLGHDVTILEARDRTGGRIHTSNLWPDAPLDLGATWIHGIKGNPLTKIARDIKAPMLATSYDATIAYHTNGTEFSDDDDEEIEALSERIAAIIEKAQDRTNDQSLRDAMASLLGNGTDAETARLVRFVLSSEIEQEYSGSITELSTHWFDSAKSFGGGDQLFVSGFRVIIDHLAKGLNILNNHIVKSIDYRQPEVRVATNVREYVADRVLVTLPLGILKAGNVSFIPALPAEKTVAIRKLGMGVLNKCYLRFSQAFWPQDVDWLEYVPEQHGQWSKWVSFMKAAKLPILLGFNAADSGRAIEKLTDKEIVASAMTTLRTIYGDDIPEPISYQITRWASDAFSLGSYSFNALGSTPTMRKTLAKPLQTKIFFAGEATEHNYFGTAHGAYLSGLRAAKEIHRAR